jgi:sulfite oxidase
MNSRSRPHDWTPITREPLNGGPDPARLAESFLTPVSDFFVRNHGPVPALDLAAWRLRVDGLVERPVEYTFEDLVSRHAAVERAATLQCAGFRRTELMAVREIPGELPWSAESVATASWGGIRLADVLNEARPTAAARHVGFESCDVVEREGRRFAFGGSVSLADAARHDVILAATMNGEPLTAEHGWPLRVVAPNVIGARSVKWLTRIELRAEPSDNYFQARTYKRIGEPDQPPAVWSAAPPLGTLPVNAIIGRPAPGARLLPGPVRLAGFAWTGHPEGVARVEVSLDGGGAWRPATLEPLRNSGCWQGWWLEADLPPGPRELVVRATGADGEVQPADPALLWNARGYMNNAWHRVTVTVT